MSIQNGSDKTMCMKIKELNGLTADSVLNKYWTRNKVPIDIAQILYDMDIKVTSVDFTKAEQAANMQYGDILGAVLTYNDDVVIAYKQNESLNRTRFTLAHELAHCCLSHIVPSQKGYIELRRKEDKNNEREIDANIFAGELLIPENELSGVLKKFFDESFPSSEFLAQVFAVSVNVMEERLKYLKIPFIDSNKTKIICMEWWWLSEELQMTERTDPDTQALDVIGEDLRTIFEERNELDYNSTVATQLIVNTPKPKTPASAENITYLDEYRKSLLKSTDIAEKYHLNEIESVKVLIQNVINLMWTVALFSIAATIVCLILKINFGTITMPIFGTLLESIIGYVVKVLNETLRTKEKFFEQDIEMQKYDKMLGLILTVSQDDRKTDMVEKVVDNYLTHNDSQG